MLDGSWTYKQLIGETFPRKIFWSYAQLFLLNKKLPSEIQKDLKNNNININPYELLTQTYKNYNSFFDSHLDKINISQPLPVAINNYGVASSLVHSSISPVWVNCSTNTSWYWKQIQAYKYSKLFVSTIPGIKNIYLTASSTIPSSKKSSDIDLIVETYYGWSWVVRIILKSLLKILNKDVHSIIGESGLLVSQVLSKLRVNGLSQKVKKVSENKIYKYKNRQGIKIDVGLIFSDNKVLPKIFRLETRHLLFHTTLLISSKNNSSFSFGNLIYDPFEYNLFFKTCIHLLRVLIYLVGIIILPISLVVYFLYNRRHKNNSNFLVDFNTICFYPLIYKEGYFYKY